LTKSQSTDRLGSKTVNTQAGESGKGKHGGLKRLLPVHEVYFAEAASVIKLDFQNHLRLLPETKCVNVNSVMSSRTFSTRSFKAAYPYTYECTLIKLKINEMIELNEVTLINLDSLENLGDKLSNEYVPTACIFQQGDSSLGVEYMENSVERDPPTPEGLTEFGQPGSFSDKNDDSQSIKKLFTHESISGPSSSLPNSGVPPGEARPDNFENHDATLENSSQTRRIWKNDSVSSSHQTTSDKPLPIRRMINLFSRHEEQQDKSFQLSEGLLVLQTEKKVKTACSIERLKKQICMAIRPLIASVRFSSDCGQHIVNVTCRKDVCRSLEPTEKDFLIRYQEELCNPTPVLRVAESEVFEENRLVLFD
ncbi:uncharacterized protein DEA37_0004207, partial [Paragonimus westermani]